jgi:hypothetical protein
MSCKVDEETILPAYLLRQQLRKDCGQLRKCDILSEKMRGVVVVRVQGAGNLLGIIDSGGQRRNAIAVGIDADHHSQVSGKAMSTLRRQWCAPEGL